MESLVRQASGEQRESLLRAIGFGLGSPETLDSLWELVEKLAPMVETAKPQLLQLGADQSAFQFLRDTAEELRSAQAGYSRQKNLLRDLSKRLLVLRKRLCHTLNCLHRAVEIAQGEADLFGLANEELAQFVGELLAAQHDSTDRSSIGEPPKAI